jgi:hypothetical protein
VTVTIADADAYISANVINNEDWTDADDAKKQRILNVAGSTLGRAFSKYTIPDNAVYEFSAVLAVIFNDTNRYQLQGVSSFSVSGVATFNFKNDGVVSASDVDLTKYIPDIVYKLVGEENGVTLYKRRIGRSVR